MPVVPGCYFASVIDVSPDRAAVALRLTGEIDIDTRRELSDVIDQLTAIAPSDIEIDIRDVTFAGSVLTHFLTRLRDALPITSTITVTHSSPLINHVLHVAGSTEIVRVGAVRSP